MIPEPDDSDKRYTRGTLTMKLNDLGFPVAEKTLATKASRGGGPPFQKFGRIPLYRWGDALEWAVSRLSKPVRSTSELEAAPRGMSRKESSK